MKPNQIFRMLVMWFVVISQIKAAAQVQDSIIYKAPLDQIQTVIEGNANFRPFASYVKSGVTGIKLIVPDRIKGKQIYSSGSLLIPEDVQLPEVVIFLHGTQFDQNVSSGWNHPFHIEALPALNGFLTILPDYIGYGESHDVTPTYFNKNLTLESVTNFARQALNYLKTKGIDFSPTVHIIGFSQGGHIALSVAESLNDSRLGTNEIKNVVAIAAPTNVSENFIEIIKQDSFKNSAYVSYIVASHLAYGSKLDPVEIFTSTMNASVQEFLANASDIVALRERTSFKMEDVLLSDFRAGKSKMYVNTVKQLSEESIGIFKTEVPILLIHSKDDQDVPYRLTREFYDRMVDLNGILNISLLEVAGDHNLSGLIGLGKALDHINAIGR